MSSCSAAVPAAFRAGGTPAPQVIQALCQFGAQGLNSRGNLLDGVLLAADGLGLLHQVPLLQDPCLHALRGERFNACRPPASFPVRDDLFTSAAANWSRSATPRLFPLQSATFRDKPGLLCNPTCLPAKPVGDFIRRLDASRKRLGKIGRSGKMREKLRQPLGIRRSLTPAFEHQLPAMVAHLPRAAARSSSDGTSPSSWICSIFCSAAS